MHRFLAVFLAALLLLQIMGPDVLVLDYQLNKARITARYCVNKARPALHCNGRCHLAQQLRKAEGGDKKAPAETLGKVKFEVLPTARLVLPGPGCWRQPGPRFAPYPTPRRAAGVVRDVFRPPLFC